MNYLLCKLSETKVTKNINMTTHAAKEMQVSESDKFLNGNQCESCGQFNATSNSQQQPPGVMSLLCLVALKRRLWLLPILTSGWLLISFWTSYAIAVSYNHTEADFPYISHTAIEAPERCVFGQMVNIGAVMLGMNVILRYLFVKRFLLCKKLPYTKCWYKINIAGVVLGILSALGLSMVANFQTEVQRTPHYVGAFLAFGLGMIYCWFQTSLSYKMHYAFNSKWILAVLQLLNSIVMSILLVLFIASKVMFKVQEAAGKGTKWFGLREIYLTSTITEWLLALSVLTFTLTYAPTFKNMQVDDPNVRLLELYEKKHSANTLKNTEENKDSDENFLSEGRQKGYRTSQT